MGQHHHSISSSDSHSNTPTHAVQDGDNDRTQVEENPLDGRPFVPMLTRNSKGHSSQKQHSAGAHVSIDNNNHRLASQC